MFSLLSAEDLLLANVQVTGPGGNTNFTVPISGSTYSYTLPAPGTTGSYQVVSSFAPASGNSLSPATSAPQPLTVTPSTATVTEQLTPNSAQPGGTVIVNGTVTSPSGPLTGTVQLYVSPSAKYVCATCDGIYRRMTVVSFSRHLAGTMQCNQLVPAMHATYHDLICVDIILQMITLHILVGRLIALKP